MKRELKSFLSSFILTVAGICRVSIVVHEDLRDWERMERVLFIFKCESFSTIALKVALNFRFGILLRVQLWGKSHGGVESQWKMADGNVFHPFPPLCCGSNKLKLQRCIQYPQGLCSGCTTDNTNLWILEMPFQNVRGINKTVGNSFAILWH